MSLGLLVLLVHLSLSCCLLPFKCAVHHGTSLGSEPAGSECGNLQQLDCCARCYQQRYTQGCIGAVWNVSGCCIYYNSISHLTPKKGSDMLIADWAPAPTPSPLPPTPPSPPTPTPVSPVPCGTVSPQGTTWVILDREKCNLTCPHAECTFSFDTIRVEPGGELHIDDTSAAIGIYVRMFIVDGKLIAGTKDRPFRSHFKIVLAGNSSNQDDPAVPKEVLGHGGGALPYSKMLLAGENSVLSLHGLRKTSWVKLARTARAGSSLLELAGEPIGWRKGDQLIIPSTGMIKDVNGSGENEVVTLAKEPSGISIALQEVLQFDHFANLGDARLNGEVGVLTHNIQIMGDNSNDQHNSCESAMRNGFGNTSLQNIREHCYGGHTASLQGATLQISGVEMRRMGQATRIARYPIHWHLAADQSQFGSYVNNNSIWQSYQRCVTVHGTWGAQVEDNVCYHTHGHAIYLEDAIEHNNRFVHNLVVDVRPGPMVCTDQQVGPSAFWITNPNNSFVDNLAVDIGTTTTGIGFWMISGGDPEKEVGPSYIDTNFWTSSYQNKTAGFVFNPSRSVFKGPHPNSTSHKRQDGVRTQLHLPAPSWMLGQQQARTPLKEFHGNGVRSSFRGVFIDGFVTASVPGEIGDVKTDPEALHSFDEASGGSVRDGTCNFFPAGKRNTTMASAEGLHVYAPTNFSYDGGHAKNFSAAWSIMDRLHVSRCYEAWWSRAARINITNAIFAYNWVGMTNHIPGTCMCAGSGDPANPGLANNIIDSLFVGHGDNAVIEQLCASGSRISLVEQNESLAAIRQYDGAFWLTKSHWVNMSTIVCPKANQSGNGGQMVKTLPFALVAGRQVDCNGKFPIHLYNAWPLGASPGDNQSQWSWALAENGDQKSQNLLQLTGTASCGVFRSGGLVDLTGTLDPMHPSLPTAYFAASGSPQNPGELAYYPKDLLDAMNYSVLTATAAAKVKSYAWSADVMVNPDFAHICGYCYYDVPRSCPQGPTRASRDVFLV